MDTADAWQEHLQLQLEAVQGVFNRVFEDHQNQPPEQVLGALQTEFYDLGLTADVKWLRTQAWAISEGHPVIAEIRDSGQADSAQG